LPGRQALFVIWVHDRFHLTAKAQRTQREYIFLFQKRPEKATTLSCSANEKTFSSFKILGYGGSIQHRR
jgi:hypothetical protein